jgi:hypothetical protein
MVIKDVQADDDGQPEDRSNVVAAIPGHDTDVALSLDPPT